MKYIRGLFISLLIFGSNCLAQSQWSWLFKKEFAALSGSKELIFTQDKTPGFTQMLFSWNALRPAVGYYAFYSQVKLSNGIWDQWHHMADWGKDKQRSFYSQSPSGVKYNYVRLEIPSGLLGNGFRLKVVPCQGADVSGVKSIAANVAHMPSFQSSVSDVEHLPSALVYEVPTRSQMVLNHQRSKAMCSPTSTSMLVSYLKSDPVEPLDFAKNSLDHGLNIYGSWPFNTAAAFEQCDGNMYFRVARLNSFSDLHKRLAANLPVVVSVRGSIDGAPQSYPSGHLLLVRGWDKDAKYVICNDPACKTDDKVLVRYPLQSFVEAWGRSHNLSYVPEPKKL